MNGAIGTRAVGSGLDAALARLLAGAGGQAIRLIDGRSARVLGSAGWGRRQDVTALVRLAAQALPVAATDGGLTDLVVTAGRTVHVLRPGPASTVLALRLSTGDDLDTARRVLAAPQTFGALSAVMPIRSVPSSAKLPVQPTTPWSMPVSGQRTGVQVRPGQPALSALSGPAATGQPGPGPSGPGAIAALALGAGSSVLPLPRRPHPEETGQAHPGDWARDSTTLRRVLAGLRRLS